MAERENHNTVADVIGMVQRRAEAAFTLGYTGAATELRNAADEARRMTRVESWGAEEPCQRQALAEASFDALIDELGPAVAMRRLLDRHGEPEND